MKIQKTAMSKRFDYIPTQREQRWGLHLIATGKRIEPPGTHYQRPEAGNAYGWNDGRVLLEYGIIYITDGKGMFRNRHSRWQRLRAGDVIFITPGTWHDYRPSKSTGWTERWILFNGDQARRWTEHGLVTEDSPILHLGIHGRLTSLFERVLELGEDDSPFCNQIQAAVCAEIVAQILQYHQLRQTGRRNQVRSIEKALDLIREQWTSDIDFEVLPARLGVSARHFRRIFLEATGLSPKQYLLNIRLNAAKSLLGTMPVYQVAERVGFSNPLYFSRLFKSKIGVPPSQWR